MKALCLLVVYMFAVSPAVWAQTIAHVRPIDPWAAETLERGLARSTLVRELVLELESSDVIVHIETRESLPAGVAGMTRLAAAAGGYRYVRIGLSRALLPDNRTSILGHELQHACELARSRATSTDEVRALFASIGHAVPGAKNTFETRAAAEAGVRVWFELHGHPRSSKARAVER